MRGTNRRRSGCRSVKLYVVINKRAGSVIGRDGDELARVISHGFRHAGHDVTVELAKPDALAAATRAAMASGTYDVVIVGGGDGTIRTAAELALEHGAVLGVIPLGTMNLLARDLGIPLDVAGAVDALAHGALTDIDVASVNDSIFLCNSLIGLPTRHAVERQRLRGANLIRGALTYLKKMRLMLASRHRLEMVIDDGREKRVFRALSVAVTSNRYDEDAGIGFVRSRLDGGHLTIYLALHRSGWRMVPSLVRAFFGRWSHDPQLEAISAKSLRISSSRRHMRVSNDGEVERLRLPLRYEISTRRLRVLAPAAVADAAAVRQESAIQDNGNHEPLAPPSVPFDDARLATM